jgi:hypothetical protein
MIRRLAIASICALALGGCATYDSGYRQGYADGNDRGSYNDGYYVAPENGYGDYYYDRPQVVADEYWDYGYPYSGFGYGFGYFPGNFGFGFNSGFGYSPWYGYGYPYYWYRPGPRHHHHDNDHDADDPPGGWSSGSHNGVAQAAVTAPGLRSGVRSRLVWQPRQEDRTERYQRDPIRRPMTVDAPRTHDGDAFRAERREPSGNRSHSHDASQR